MADTGETETFRIRLATEADLPALHVLMGEAITALQSELLTREQVAASHAVMGLDAQLVADRTYLLAEDAADVLLGCGGWSWRATLYGGDASQVAREPAALNPATDAARVRAMYTAPAAARRGVGRAILAACEGAATAAGFRRAELMATLAGERLYRACGWTVLGRTAAEVGKVSVPLVRMTKTLARKP